MTIKRDNGIWEWHDVTHDITSILDESLSNDWNFYTNNGGGSTIVGRFTIVRDDQESYSKVLEVFESCLNEYIKENNLNINLSHMGNEYWLFREYNAGSVMSAHSDAYSYVTKDGQPVKPYLTIILYMNDDYEGGEINFIHDGVCISPKPASVVIFPSNLQHEVLTIKSGNRYMTQTYVYDHPVSYYDNPNAVS